MRTGAIVAITALALGLAATVPEVAAKSAPQPPNNGGSSSPLVRYGYFTSLDLFPNELRRVTDFPAAIKEFDATKDTAVVFVGAIDSPGKDFTITGILKAPDGTRVELFTEERKYSPTLKWYPVRRMISMSRLQPGFGGKWALELLVDGQPVGTYGFEVAPDLALAKSSPSTSSPATAATPVAPPQTLSTAQSPPSGPSVLPITSPFGVKVEFTGPPRLRFKVDGKEHVLDEKGNAEVRLRAAEHDVEVKGGGFKPYKEKLKITSDMKSAQHKIAVIDGVAPAIAVLEPKSGAAPLVSEDARLKFEVKGEARLSAVRIISGGRVVDRLTPNPAAKAGEALILQSTVRLAEGPNKFTIEAEDENEKTGQRAVEIEVERKVAVEIKTEPFAKVSVNKREQNADRTGLVALRLFPGDYDVEVSKPGFKTIAERMTVPRGQRSVERHFALVAPLAPSIALLEPAAGADPVLGDDARIKIEVKGESKLTALRIVKDGRIVERLAPDSRYRPGQPWIVESTVRGLVEGDNNVTLEAEDENGRAGKRTVVVAREKLIAVELKSEPFAKLVINKREFTADRTGSLPLRLLPGDYEIEASKPGFKLLTERLTVVRGQSAKAHALQLTAVSAPVIALLEPAAGADPVLGDDAKLKVEVKGESRVTTLRIVKDSRVIDRLTPDTRLRADQAWIVEPTVRGLVEGDNSFTLEAEDENGRAGKRTIVVAREKLIAVELKGDPSSKIFVNKKEFTLGLAGTLTLRLLPGDYLIEASKMGFKPINDTMTVKRGQPSLSYTLPFRRPDAPRIVLLDPKDGAAVATHSPDIKVEVHSSERITMLKVVGLQEVMLRPTPNAPRGEVWIAETTVRLAKGTNDITLEAVDEHGIKATKVVKLTYDPSAQVARVEPPRSTPTTRDILPPPPPKPEPPRAIVGGVDYGRYHALIIGNSRYDTLQPLKTPVMDAQAVYDKLTREYGFSRSNVRLLRDATRSQIMQAIFQYRQRLGDRDNLLLYYAGHGILDSDSDRGYWLPVDAAQDAPDTWLSTAEITDHLKAMKAKHVLVVSDSCYSGAMRDVAVIPARQTDILRLAQRRARTLLASGGVEPVSDSGGGNHSVFAKAFLDALDDVRGVTFVSSLFTEIKRKVELNSDQRPLYSPIKLAGHDDGDFILVRQSPETPSGTKNSP